MTIKSKLEDDLKNAMRNRDVLRRDAIRFLRAEIKNQEIRVQRELDDEGSLQVLTRQAQQRRDSIQAFMDAGREDLAEKEQAELGIIMEYLPSQMTADEIAELAAQVVAELGAQGPGDMGKVMSSIMPQVRGRAEGRDVNTAVMRILRGL